MITKQKKNYILLAAIVLLAFLLRAYHLESSSLWTDELATYWVATAPSLANTVDRAAITQGQSPFYFILERFVLAAFTVHSEWHIRLVSLVSSVLSVVVMYSIGLLLFKKRMAAIVAALIFALNVHQVYYAQEARPYALAILLSLLSQLYFLKLCKQWGAVNGILYVVSSVLACYCHYFMAPLLIAQNIYVVYLWQWRQQVDLVFIKRWILANSCIGLSFIGVLFHLKPMFSNRGKWGWLSTLGLWDSCWLFLDMFEVRVILVMLLIGLICGFFERLKLRKIFWANRDAFFMVATWWLVPFAFCYLITLILKVPLVAERYLFISLLAVPLFMGKILTMFYGRVIRYALIFGFCGFYFWTALLPPLQQRGMFCYRVPHDWRAALQYIEKNMQPGDAVLCRTGFVKENWIPFDRRNAVQEYPKCPFYSFYWENDLPVIYNMTYTMDKAFDAYYDSLLESKLTRFSRIWVMGVDPPNTNYPVSKIPVLLRNVLRFKQKDEKVFSGVYVALMIKHKHNKTE